MSSSKTIPGIALIVSLLVAAAGVSATESHEERSTIVINNNGHITATSSGPEGKSHFEGDKLPAEVRSTLPAELVKKIEEQMKSAGPATTGGAEKDANSSTHSSISVSVQSSAKSSSSNSSTSKSSSSGSKSSSGGGQTIGGGKGPGDGKDPVRIPGDKGIVVH